jgi:type IV pilus assembly protein PilC
MTAYQYVAEDARGGRISGVYEDIPDPEHLREDLGKLGYRVIEARRMDGKGADGKKRGKIRPAEIVAFAYEFSGMFTAGLSVVRCLETMEEQTTNEQMRTILSSVRQSIETGASIAQAFEPYRSVFGDFFMGMLEAGQTGGKLSQTLKTAAEYYEKQLEVKNKVKGAFIYPVVVALLCVVILSAIVIFVIPVFQKLYQQLHIELPLPTQILILISELFRHHFYVFPILLGAGYWGWKGIRDHPGVREKLDRFCLKIPVLGPLIQMMLLGGSGSAGGPAAGTAGLPPCGDGCHRPAVGTGDHDRRDPQPSSGPADPLSPGDCAADPCGGGVRNAGGDADQGS